MKKLMIILFTVAIASVNGFSQGPPSKNAAAKTPEQRAENQTKRLTKELGLTAEQQAKAKAIILKREEEKENLQKATREGHEKTKAEFKAFLTPEQFQKFEKKEEEMKKNREERRKQSPPPPKVAPQSPTPIEK
jgi:Spy/CpxP family protein refolding chaperone